MAIKLRHISRILQGRVSNPSERGIGGRARLGSGEGLCPFPENFGISDIKMMSFYAFPEIFIDTVTVVLAQQDIACFEHNFFSKRAP